MTPKEKAKELFWKFFEAQAKENEDFVADGETAIKSALIAVDEIMNALPPFDYGLEFVAKIQYWLDVKTEILAL